VLPEQAAPLLDVPIERTTYRLGPDDVIDVSIFGEVNRQFSVRVTPEGTLILPGIGFVNVLDLNLNEAEAQLRLLINRNYRNVDVYATLSRVRRFNVFLVGAVPEPGVRAASAVTRVSELIPPSDSVIRRNVLVRRAGGDTLRVDAARFRQLGDINANPLLRQGDVVLVPPIDRTVMVFGRVDFPGTYEYRPGEALADLLTVANGGDQFPSNAADTVRIARFTGPEERTVVLMSRAEALGARGRAMIIEPFDAVYVPERANFMEPKSAMITGQVVRPGTYPIYPGVTTARSIVEMAGGFTDEASLVTATLRREPVKRDDLALDLQAIPPELLTPHERGILLIRTQGDESNVVLDFQALFAEGTNALDQPLQAGDSLHVPRRRDEVVVLGAVRQPGVVRHAPMRPPSYFLDQAGGLTRRADGGEVVVLKAKLGTRLQASEVDQLDPGDTIIAPFKETRTFMDYVRDVSAVATPLSALILTWLAIRNAN
jgi:protein involved in polysaccharide export with SLBB domain